MIKREAEKTILEMAEQFKVVSVTGPRQSGKTYLVRALFPEKPYINLEEPDTRLFAIEDPRRFLQKYPDGAVIDEIQHAPELLSYIQSIVDVRRDTGIYIITGSQHFTMLEAISQSLAGRVGIIHLLPFSYMELHKAKVSSDNLEQTIFKGAYPPLYDQPLVPEKWLNSYISTYLERDVRKILNIKNLSIFQKFLSLCAGYSGQMINYSRIGADCGIDHNTVHSWMDILEESFLIFRLKPYYKNFRKRIVKMPKLYFYDTGLASRLIGIENSGQISTHPSRGFLFENWIISEFMKSRYNRGKDINLYFWRNNTGIEIDLIIDHPDGFIPVEIKSGSTFSRSWADSVIHWKEMAGNSPKNSFIIYGGNEFHTINDINIVPWQNIGNIET
ncbi:MAG TPA: AAA family ATPase [Lentisphaeria bacterium]|nr:AAA family ATPase [Lentisphaeria bacterium]